MRDIIEIETTYHENGNIKSKTTITNGYYTGLHIQYYKNGNKKYECICIKCLEIGIYQSWNKNKSRDNIYVCKNEDILLNINGPKLQFNYEKQS